MDSKLLEFYTNMRVVRKKLKELQEQYEFCGIVFLDVNSETFLFTGQKLRELFENPNSRILQSCNIRRINDFIRNLYETEETKEYFNPCNITNIKVEDEQGSYWVQLYAWKWKFTRGRSLAGIIWIKLEEKNRLRAPSCQVIAGYIKFKSRIDTGRKHWIITCLHGISLTTECCCQKTGPTNSAPGTHIKD